LTPSNQQGEGLRTHKKTDPRTKKRNGGNLGESTIPSWETKWTNERGKKLEHGNCSGGDRWDPLTELLLKHASKSADKVVSTQKKDSKAKPDGSLYQFPPHRLKKTLIKTSIQKPEWEGRPAKRKNPGLGVRVHG